MQLNLIFMCMVLRFGLKMLKCEDLLHWRFYLRLKNTCELAMVFAAIYSDFDVMSADRV